MRRAAQQIAGRRIHAESRLGGAAVGGDDHAALEKAVGDFDRGLEHAARVVAQIDDEAFERSALLAPRNVPDRALDILRPSCR